MFTVWNAYGTDCADVESPTRSESHYLAEFPTSQQAEDFAAEAYEMLIAQAPEWQSLTVFVTEWQAPEGAPVIVADLFADLTASHLDRLMGGAWEANSTGDNADDSPTNYTIKIRFTTNRPLTKDELADLVNATAVQIEEPQTDHEDATFRTSQITVSY